MTEKEIQGRWEAEPPPREAIHIEKVVNPLGGEPVIGSVRHPGHAWMSELPPGTKLEGDLWAGVGRAYLEALSQAAGFVGGKDGWLAKGAWNRLMEPLPPQIGFRWLGLTWSTEVPAQGEFKPYGSFWVPGMGDVASAQGTLVLLAGNADASQKVQFRHNVGLRIAMHVTGSTARVFGVTLSGLATDRALGESTTANDLVRRDRKVHIAIGRALDCNEAGVQIRGIERIDGASGIDLFDVRGTVMRYHGDRTKSKRSLGRSRLYDFYVRMTPAPHVEQVYRCTYLGSAARPSEDLRTVGTCVAGNTDLQKRARSPRASLIEPASTNDELRLKQARADLNLELDAGVLGFAPEVGAISWFETQGASRIGPGAAATTTTSRSRPTVTIGSERNVMSDEQGSIDTHVHAAEMFMRMDAYGLRPETYFRFARLPLVQRVRPQMLWAPDGELPNAEARPFVDPLAAGPIAANTTRSDMVHDRPQLLIRYGSASPWHRNKLPYAYVEKGQERRRKAQYLSVASDPRWAWHEFGHVLAYASTGELEFPFAHSAGDALAAIVSDPRSPLANAAEAPARFVTFPWIEVPGRSHGRRAEHGYGWCGTSQPRAPGA